MYATTLLTCARRIVRDYEQYIARQLKRGTTRQELNVSWLKKNELDIKRHVAELRDSIRTNWTATGQELGRDLRQFWQPSRPNSPARGLSTPDRLGYNLRQGPSRGSNSDFAAGYTMGLLGSVRSWVSLEFTANPSDPLTDRSLDATQPQNS